MNEKFSNASESEILEFHKKVADNIRNFRENAGISQLDLALEIGIKSVAFYSNFGIIVKKWGWKCYNSPLNSLFKGYKKI